MVTAPDLGADAVRQLRVGQSSITAASAEIWPDEPGLYAVYASPEVWRTLTLGDPPDDRPLYVGKAERSLSSRDVVTHFGFVAKRGNSITGSSTLRRSLSAMLRTSLGFRGQYRNPANPGYPDKFGLSPSQDSLLSDWMRANLRATYWEMTSDEIPLGEVETAVLRQLRPPLNLDKVAHQWTTHVRAARKVMAADCPKLERAAR